MSGEPLDTAIDPKVLQDLASYFHAPSQELSNLHITSDYSMNNSSAASAAPIDMAPRVSAAGNSAQLSGSAASFGTDSYRGGLANSFHQLQQHHPSFQQQQHQSHQSGLFRQQLGSPTHAEMFSPGTDDLGDLSPGNSYPSHSLAAMASGTLPTSIPGSLLGSQQRQVAVAATDQMLRMQAFSASPPPNSPGGNFQSMSLPAHSEWFESQLGQHQNIGSALDPSSFAAQQITGTSGAEFSPQNPTLMSLVEDGDDGSQKSVIMNIEKRRRRRESHNAVERRRRDNINDRIQELYMLLPESIIDVNIKPNKGVILKKSVEYIRQLQQMVQSLHARNQELESGMSSAAAGQQQQQQHPPASSGLAAMLASAAGTASRPPGSDGSMMNTGL